MKTILTPEAPAPGGHYAQAILHGGLVYVSGQLPIRPADPAPRPTSFEEEARQVLANLDAVLHAAGSRRDLVLRTTVYIADMALWGAFNAIYAEFFGDHRPARSVVPTLALHYGFKVELDAIAALSLQASEA